MFNMTKTMMRVDKNLLAQLKARKQVARESYADVVKRMIDNEVKNKNSYYMSPKARSEHNAFLKRLNKIENLRVGF